MTARAAACRRHSRPTCAVQEGISDFTLGRCGINGRYRGVCFVASGHRSDCRDRAATSSAWSWVVRSPPWRSMAAASCCSRATRREKWSCAACPSEQPPALGHRLYCSLLSSARQPGHRAPLRAAGPSGHHVPAPVVSRPERCARVSSLRSYRGCAPPRVQSRRPLPAAGHAERASPRVQSQCVIIEPMFQRRDFCLNRTCRSNAALQGSIAVDPQAV